MYKKNNFEVGSSRGAGLWDAIRHPIDTIKEAFRGAPSKYSNAARRTLEKYGDVGIVQIQVARTPLEGYITGFINVISFGKFKEMLKKRGFDKLFHLFMICKLENGVNILLEKNEVITIVEHNKPFTENTDYIDILPPDGLTINEMVNTAQQEMGNDAYFSYDPFKNNCQVYIAHLLDGVGLYDEDAKNFIMQDVSELYQDATDEGVGYVPSVLKGVTDFASIFSRLKGDGKKKKAKAKPKSRAKPKRKISAVTLENLRRGREIRAKNLKKRY